MGTVCLSTRGLLEKKQNELKLTLCVPRCFPQSLLPVVVLPANEPWPGPYRVPIGARDTLKSNTLRSRTWMCRELALDACLPSLPSLSLSLSLSLSPFLLPRITLVFLPSSLPSTNPPVCIVCSIFSVPF